MIKLEVVHDYFWEDLDEYDRVRNSEHIKYKKSSSEMVLKLKNPFDE